MASNVLNSLLLSEYVTLFHFLCVLFLLVVFLINTSVWIILLYLFQVLVIALNLFSKNCIASSSKGTPQSNQVLLLILVYLYTKKKMIWMWICSEMGLQRRRCCLFVMQWLLIAQIVLFMVATPKY